MIYIPYSTREEMIIHSLDTHPIESCGVLYSKENINYAYGYIPMRNISNRSDFFEFDSQEQFNIFKKIDMDGYKICGICHSHTGSNAFPSMQDISFLSKIKGMHQIIVSTLSDIQIRSYLISSNCVVEERIKFI